MYKNDKLFLAENEIPKYKFNNVGQCWSCNNLVGYSVEEIQGYFYKLPQCKICDAYMINVYKNPCESLSR